MQQPELGKRLTALRKEKNLTQEELVEKSHVSVRTIQRIEAGEVMPRMSTVKILLHALGETLDSFTAKTPEVMEIPANTVTDPHRHVLLVAALAGAVYLVAEIILGVLDISWITGHRDWTFPMNVIYAGLTAVMVLSYVLFARGFIALSAVFENPLLKRVVYMLLVATVGMGVLDIASLSMDEDTLWLPYAAASVLSGALSLAFGIALIQLQDGMGELSRIAGLLEIITGFLLITVVLFFVAYVTLIPAVVVEILILYRGYEYLSRPQPPPDAA